MSTLKLRPETKRTYTGTSEGVRLLINGYYEYGEEINTKRSFPDIRDGFKTVQRRAGYAFIKNPAFFKGFVKSAKLVGETNHYHPHGDGAIYEAITRLVGQAGYMQLPILTGMGNWGSRIAGENAAAFRYTQLKASDWAHELRHEYLDCVPMVEAELLDGTMEPEFLSVPYPNILMNEQQGMGLGIASKIPSFNFHDVIALTEKYIRDGKLGIDDVIFPDFTCGGLLVADREVATRVMLKGLGTFRTRALVSIEKDVIRVHEIPAGHNLTSMKKKLKDILEKDRIPDLKSYQDAQEYKKNKGDASSELNIYCKRGTAEKVLTELYRLSILEASYSVNMLANYKDKVVIGGVHSFIERWVKFRRDFLKGRFEEKISAFEDELNLLRVFLALVDDVENKEEFLHRLTRVSKRDAQAFLEEIFPGLSADTNKWICSRPADSFLDGGKYRNRYDAILATIESHKYDMEHLDEVLLRDLANTKKVHAGHHARRTELTTTAYKFKKLKAQGGTAKRPKLVDDALTYFVFTADGFVLKSKSDLPTQSNELLRVRVPANTEFIGFDSAGSILRVYGEELEYGNTGTYFYKYANINPDGANPVYWCVNDGEARHVLLRSSNMVVFDPNHNKTTRRIRHQFNKVNLAISTEGIAHVFEPGTLPRYLMLVDTYQSGRREINRVATLDTNDMRPAKSSNTKISLTGTTTNLFAWVGLSQELYENANWLADDHLRHKFVGTRSFRQFSGYPEITEAFSEDFNFMDQLRNNDNAGIVAE